MFKTMKLVTASLLIMLTVFPAISHATVPDKKSRVIITFLNNQNAKEQESSFVKNNSNVILEKYKNVHSYVAELTDSKSAQLDENSNIIVEKDVKVKMSSAYTPNTNWGAVRIGSPLANFGGLTGKGVKIGIVDSGIQTNNPRLKVYGGYNFVSNNKFYSDSNGHGTHVAGIIAAQPGDGFSGIAPDAQLYALKVLNNIGEGYVSDIIAAINWAIQNKLDIINLSLGEEAPLDTLEQVVNNAYASGLLIVAAAGNDGGTVEYPAAYPSVIAVGATNSSDQLASYSARGKQIEVTAPGDYIFSTYIGNKFAYLSGTSMAAPHVTGVLALYKQKYPDLSNVQLRNLMDKNAVDLGPRGRDSSFGFGLVRAPFSLGLPKNSLINLKAVRLSPTEVRLVWKNSSAGTYVIKRDGVVIYTGNSSNYFIDKDASVGVGKICNYTITCSLSGGYTAEGKAAA